MKQPDIWQLLNELPHPEQPFITVINAQGRVELSGRTLVNGISKAANAFRNILDAEPGQSAKIELGWTWQQGVWHGAALVAGLHVVSEGEADFAITPKMISTHPFGLPSGEPEDMTAEVLGEPDLWLYPDYFPEQIEIIEQARMWGHEHGVTAGTRIGVDTSVLHKNQPNEPHYYLPFLVPLANQCSIVVFDQAGSAIGSLMEQEKITVLLTP